MKIQLLLVLLLVLVMKVAAQYAPPPGQAGTTAIYKDSSVFKGWATGCTIVRGPMDISNPAQGNASAGDQTLALGKAGENGVVSLGDGGSATLTFENPFMNGPGYDFAVFENSFADDFLELAFVEVSSDGNTYFRFPAVSLTNESVQVGSFDLLDTRKIHNLAGKYRALYGTPFDLEELKGKTGLDVNSITHIRIIDVVGSIDNRYATFDKDGRKVNDPWPTSFASGGFDLDAVGIIHFAATTSVAGVSGSDKIEIYPNPVAKNQDIKLSSESLSGNVVAEIFDAAGAKVKEKVLIDDTLISTEGISPGLYTLKLKKNQTVVMQRLVVY